MRRFAFALLLVPALAGAADPGLPPGTLARRGDASITAEDIDARMARIPEQDRAATIANPERLESILSGVLLSRQLANEARAAGLDKDPGVQREIALAVEAVLASNRLDQVRREAKADVAQLAREVYQSNRSQFAIPERRTVRHILVRQEKRSKDEARTIAERALADARTPGADFGAIAEKVSEDEVSRLNGGLLPEFGPGTMDPAFETAAFALKKPGDIGEVVETTYGFHLVQLVAIEPAKPRPFEEVRADLERQLEEKHRNETVQKHADTLRNLPVEADEQAVAALRTRYDHLVPPPAIVKLPGSDEKTKSDAPEATPAD